VIVVALHLALPIICVAQTDAAPPPLEVKINKHAAAAAVQAGISQETLDAVAKAIQEYGVSWDLGDAKRHRAAITGTPAMLEVAVLSMHAEQAQRAANELAREKLNPPLPIGATQPAKREPYPRTNYHRAVLDEMVVIKGDDQRVTISRPPFTSKPSYIVEKAPAGWRVVISEDELSGAAPDKAAEAFKQQRKGFEQLREQVAAGRFKTWQEYSDAASAIRRTFKDQLKAATPETAPAAR
jgi:hypothetical protein